jgi:uncharacterized protein YaaQ
MKLLLAIVNNDDAHYVNTCLTSEGFHVTKISSTGGFLMNGNSTFLIGVEDENVEKAIDVIKNNSQKRQMNMPPIEQGNSARIATGKNVISVGGATIFVLNVEQYIHL